ncbi:hypothetical protein B9K03_08815 [Rothia sp. Olga]|nr:hypothetical protein B9K03_08815 [Rothia sp. Olga]
MGSILARGAAARTGQAGDFGMRDTPRFGVAPSLPATLRQALRKRGMAQGETSIVERAFYFMWP